MGGVLRAQRNERVLTDAAQATKQSVKVRWSRIVMGTVVFFLFGGNQTKIAVGGGGRVFFRV
jgi:hypothetical protein